MSGFLASIFASLSIFGSHSGPVVPPAPDLPPPTVVLKREVRKLKDQNARLRHALKIPIVVRIGRALERRGFRVSENPAFGGVDPVHAPGSNHYPPCSCAIDVNWMYGDEASHLDWVYKRVRLIPGVFEILWRVPDHNDHLHLAAI